MVAMVRRHLACVVSWSNSMCSAIFIGFSMVVLGLPFSECSPQQGRQSPSKLQ
jgi:hypothetical protein